MFCRSLSCALDQSNCDVAEQKMQKVPSFLLRCLLNCGRVSIFAAQSRTKASQIGRLAQLVQSVCLTSRGSGVRIPQRPHIFRQLSIGRWVADFFVCERNARGWGECTQVRRSAVCITGVGRFYRRVFLRRGSGRMQFRLRGSLLCLRKSLVSPPRETGRWVALFSEKDGEKKRKEGRC